MGQHHHQYSENEQHQDETSKNLLFAFFLNLIFTIVEIVGGIYTNSVAVLSNALHNLGDSITLGLSWYFKRRSKRKRDNNYTYGYGRFSLLAAFVNSIVLIIGSLIIIFMALPRLINPEHPDVIGMMFLAFFGIVFNWAAMLRVKKGKILNEKVTFHSLKGVLGWVAVLIIGIVMYYWHFPLLDPLLSLIFTAYILISVIKSFRKTIRIFLQGKPDNIDLQIFQEKLLIISGLKSVHDLHVWSMDGSFYVATLHMVVEDYVNKEQILNIKNQIRDICTFFDIQHVTLEVEFESERCELEKQYGNIRRER